MNSSPQTRLLYVALLSHTSPQVAPPGFDSVCGTESNQRVPVLQLAAARGDKMAKTLVTNGDVYGKQFVVYDSCQAYPAYVVTYACPDDMAPAPEPPRKQVFDWFTTWSCRSCGDSLDGWVGCS